MNSPSEAPEPTDHAGAQSDGGERRDIATPPSDWSRRYRLAWVAAGLLLVVSFAWIRYSVGGPRTSQVFQDVVVAAGAVAAALAVTYLVRQLTGQTRRGWQFLAVGFWLEALGEVTWLAYSVLAADVPFPGLADVFYLPGYVFLAAGFVVLAVDPRDTRPRVRFTLDGLVIATALLTLGWHFSLEPLIAASPLTALATWLSVAYPVLDIVVASIGLVVAMNARGRRRLSLLLVAGGVFAWAVGDVAFVALEFGDGYAADELGLFWLLGDLAVMLGALHPDASAPPTVCDARHFKFHELAVPYVPFLATMGVVSYLGFTNSLDRGDVLFGALVVVFVVARQMYISRDAARLGDELDASERSLARRNEELLLVNRIVRHDIRNDMAVANGWAGELREHVDEAGEPMLERVLRTTQHTIDLTETLRDFVEALEPGTEADLEPTSLSEHLRETIESCRETYPHAAFEVGEIPDVRVEANALLGTVFRNLLNNAVQHNDTDEPRVDVSAQTTDGSVRVRIADNGPGLPEERREAVFGRAERGLNSAGSGVGLYLVDTLVRQYGGDVWVEDAEPQGAVFVVELNRVD
jgi:signal transduction histidine kinase